MTPEPPFDGRPEHCPPRRALSRRNLPLLAILTVALLLRALVAVAGLREPEMPRESDDYVGMAADWIEAGRYMDTARPPGYPFLARLLITCFGSPGVFRALLALHVLTGVAAVWLLFRIAGLAGLGRAEALTAAALLTLDPITVSYTFQALTETVYLFLLLLGVWCALLPGERSGGRLDIRGALGAGFSLAAASLVRTVGLPVTAVLGIWTVSAGSGRLRGRLARAALILGLVATSALAWSYRNYLHYGHAVYTPSSGLIFAMMWVGPARAAAEGRPIELIEALYVWPPEEVGPAYYSDNAAERSKALGAAARRWALRNPDAMIAGLTRATFMLWLGPGRGPWEKLTGLDALPPAIVALLVLWRLVFLVGGIAGVFLWWDTRPQHRNALIAVILLILVNPLALGCGGYPRYAAPMIPFLCLLVAVAAVQGLRMWRERALSAAHSPDTT